MLNLVYSSKQDYNYFYRIMKSLLPEIKDILGKPYADLEFLLLAFKKVLEENDEVELASQVPWISDCPPDFSLRNHEKLLHLYSICFQFARSTAQYRTGEGKKKAVV